MTWRNQWKANQLTTWYASIRHRKSRRSALQITANGHIVKKHEFQIVACTHVSGAGSLVLTTKSIRTDPTITTLSNCVAIEIDGNFQIVPLIESTCCTLHLVDLIIASPSVQRYRFDTLRKEKTSTLFDSNIKPEASGKTRLARVEKPKPAPNHEELDIKDRLLWLLTPPINEVLSDPSMGWKDFPYTFQVKGIQWLKDRDSALLADEMGLGKTMQAIIAARLLWRDNKVKQILVVCPKPLINTWREEIGKWWYAARQNTKVISQDPEFNLRLATDNITFKIINYERLARLADRMKEIKFSHDLIIIDEAQRIKNPNTSTARAVKALHGKRRWALTGTPLENKVGDVVSIFEFLRPGLIEQDDAAHVRDRIGDFMLRRRADEVDIDLPSKDDHDIPIELGDRQREAYERAQRDGVVELNEKGDSITFTHVFALIGHLMRLCNFEPVSGDSAKIDRISTDLAEILDSERKVLIFSQFTSKEFGIARLVKELPKQCKSQIPAGIAEMHGKISDSLRMEYLKRFEIDPSLNIMLLQYRVGGVGLNLQAANYVYLFDRWWNPSVEDQAVKRVHRLGQKNKVFIRRLYCVDTIEERILKKIAEKRRLFTQVIDDANPTVEMTGLTNEEVFSLFEDLIARPKYLKKKKIAPQLILDNMDPNQFEVLIADIYRADGYKVEETGGSHDGGIDLIVQGIRGETIVVQCKRWEGVVGVNPVRELWGVVNNNQKITQGHVVAINGYSREAIAFANGKRLSLIDRSWIKKKSIEHGIARLE